MTPRDKRIIKLYTGRPGDQIELAKMFGVTPGRISQIVRQVHPSQHTDWTEIESEFIAKNYCRGMSASKIAAVLGRTRNEVIGRAYRMGLGRAS